MTSFMLKKLKKSLELDERLGKIEGFRYAPKLKNNDIKEIMIVNPEIIDKLIKHSFDKKYKAILELYLKAMSEEDEGDAESIFMRALDEVARLRGIIIRKYQHILSNKTMEKLLKKLKILENELRVKIIDYKILLEQEKVPNMEKGKGR